MERKYIRCRKRNRLAKRLFGNNTGTGGDEIVTNNETTQQKRNNVKKQKVYPKESRVEINKDNAAAYTVLQLFDEFGKETKLDEYSSRLVTEYVRRQGVTKAQLLNLAVNFPGRTIQKLIRSDVFNEIA